MNQPDANPWELSHPTWRLAAALAVGVVGAVAFPLNLGFVPISQRTVVGGSAVVALYLALLGYEVWAQRKREGGFWWERLLRGLAISALAPLLLFASRPRGPW